MIQLFGINYILHWDVLRRQNHHEVLLEDVSKFDAQYLIIGSLSSKIESSKLAQSDIKTFLGQAPDIKDIEIQEKLKKIKRLQRC